MPQETDAIAAQCVLDSEPRPSRLLPVQYITVPHKFKLSTLRRLEDPLDIVYTAAWLQDKINDPNDPLAIPPEVVKRNPMLIEQVEPVPNERTLKEARVEYLREQFDEGSIKPLEWVIAKCKGKLYRINGNHSSSIIFNEGKPVLFSGVMVILYTYDLGDDENLLPELWSVFDNGVSSRNYGELLEINTNIVEFNDMTLDEKKRLASALGYVESRGGRGKCSASERLDLLKGYNDKNELKSIVELSRTCRGDWMKRPVLAAILFTNKINRQKSKQFWGLVAESNFPEDSPIARLRVFLRGLKIQSTMDHDEICAHCIHAWRVWLDGNPMPKPITMKYFPTTEEKNSNRLLKSYRKYLDEALGALES